VVFVSYGLVMSHLLLEGNLYHNETRLALSKPQLKIVH